MKEKKDIRELVEQAWLDFRSFLQQRGDRVTTPRRIVLETALTRTDHFRADDLAADLAKHKPRVSRGTVYRTLGLLVEAGMLREIRDSDVHIHYEPVVGRTPHDHLICDECKKFIEFSDPGLEIHLKRACCENNFSMRAHRVVVFGLCSKCQSKKR